MTTFKIQNFIVYNVNKRFLLIFYFKKGQIRIFEASVSLKFLFARGKVISDAVINSAVYFKFAPSKTLFLDRLISIRIKYFGFF